MKHTLLFLSIALVLMPMFARAQVSFTSDEPTSSSETSSEDQESSEAMYYSTSEENIVLYRNGTEVKTLQSSEQMHQSSEEPSSSSLPMADVPNTVLVSDSDFDVVVGTGSTSSEPEEVVVEETEPMDVPSTSGGMSQIVLYAVGFVAMVGGAAVGLKMMKKK